MCWCQMGALVGTSPCVPRPHHPVFRGPSVHVAWSNQSRAEVDSHACCVWEVFEVTSTWRVGIGRSRRPRSSMQASVVLASSHFTSHAVTVTVCQSWFWPSGKVFFFSGLFVFFVFLSAFLLELRQLPTERCSTESHVTCVDNEKREKSLLVERRNSPALLTTRSLLSELAKCSACWNL